MKRVCIILGLCGVVASRSPALSQGVPQSTSDIALTIGMCTIQLANFKEQLAAANAKIEDMQKQLDALKKPAGTVTPGDK